MGTTVLINKAAGTAQREGADALSRRLRDGLAQRHIDAEVELLDGGGLIARARQLAGQPGLTLVVGGGDGTVGAVASLLAGTEGVLGLLPLGTLNHFAKDLGLPQDLEGALDVIAAGQVRSVDVGEVNGQVFVNNSSIGVYPFLVAERTAEQRRRGVGKLAAIGPALWRSLRARAWHRVRIVAEDGRHRRHRTSLLFVGNNFYDLAALGKRADLCAGELCVHVVKHQSWWRLALLPFKIALLGALGRRLGPEDIESLRVKELTIQSHRRRLRVAIDGETVKLPTPLTYRIRPGGLRVLAPPTAAAAAPA